MNKFNVGDVVYIIDNSGKLLKSYVKSVNIGIGANYKSVMYDIHHEEFYITRYENQIFDTKSKMCKHLERLLEELKEIA